MAMLLITTAVSAGVVADVRAALRRHDLQGARKTLDDYRRRNGDTPEALAALSWLARGSLDAKQIDQAESYAGETRKLVTARITAGSLDADSNLALALGAAIEVHAGILAGRGDRAEAVSFLRRELKTWWDTPVRARIQKDLNLLTIEGRPAPPLRVEEWLGPKPTPLSALRGHPVLLFFWAHWCADCTDQIPALIRVQEKYGPRGLVLIGPTQHYGYVARGEEASREQETKYIDAMRTSLYAPLKGMPVPLDEENFRVYGSSTVPTLALLDRQGVVRLYHPDVIPYDELAAALERVLARPASAQAKPAAAPHTR